MQAPLLTWGEETEGAGFSPGVKKPKVQAPLLTWGEETEGAGFSPGVKKPKVQAPLLTWGEETEGAGFSPGVKKPKAITKGEKRRGDKVERRTRLFPFRLWLSPKVKGNGVFAKRALLL